MLNHLASSLALADAELIAKCGVIKHCDHKGGLRGQHLEFTREPGVEILAVVAQWRASGIRDPARAAGRQAHHGCEEHHSQRVPVRL